MQISDLLTLRVKTVRHYRGLQRRHTPPGDRGELVFGGGILTAST